MKSAHYHRLISSTALALVVLALTAAPKQADAQDEKKMRNVYRARIVDMSNRQSGLAGMADFIVTRWTLPAERTMLLNTLQDKGHDAFIKALRMREETGFLSPQTTQVSGYGSTRFRYAYQFDKEDGSKHIVIVTDRTIRERETSREIGDYDVTLIMMDFPANSDTGTGQMYWALRVQWDKKEDKLKLDSAGGSEPLRLTEIKLVK